MCASGSAFEPYMYARRRTRNIILPIIGLACYWLGSSRCGTDFRGTLGHASASMSTLPTVALSESVADVALASHNCEKCWLAAVLSNYSFQGRHYSAGGAYCHAVRGCSTSLRPADRKLALLGVQVNAEGTSLRYRIRMTYARKLPPGTLLLFAIARRGATLLQLSALAAEHGREGDLLLLDGCDEGVNSKTFSYISTVTGLFGAAAFKYFVKADSDTFVLPLAYAAMLRALPDAAPYVYGGVEYQRGRYPWSSEVTYMAGALYFLGSDLAFAIALACAPPAPPCSNDGDFEDRALGRVIEARLIGGKGVHLTSIRLNRFQTVDLVKHESGTRLLACMNAQVGAAGPPHECPRIPPLLALHALKDDATWWTVASYYESEVGLSVNDESQFAHFKAPAEPQDAIQESSRDWYPPVISRT